MKAADLTFKRAGRLIDGRVIAKDSDPRAAVWVVDVNDPDSDYMVAPEEIMGYWGVTHNRHGKPVRVFIPTKAWDDK